MQKLVYTNNSSFLLDRASNHFVDVKNSAWMILYRIKDDLRIICDIVIASRHSVSDQSEWGDFEPTPVYIVR